MLSGESAHPVGNANVSQLDDAGVNAAIDRVWDKVAMASSADVAAVANEQLGVWDFSFTALR